MLKTDQADINKIIMDAEAEEPGKKIERLEKEVKIIKGSIKKLLLDIREEMNNAENPFINIQQLQAPAATPVIKEQETEYNSDTEGTEAEPGNAEGNDNAGMQNMARGQQDGSLQDVDAQKMEIEEQKRMLEDMRQRIRDNAGAAANAGPRKIDPYTMTQIMEWTRTMLRKNGTERFNDLLDMYVLTGYISEDTKAVIQKVSRLMEAEPQRNPKKLDIKECVSDLYTLYVILNPMSKEFDSRMLSVLLNSDKR